MEDDRSDETASWVKAKRSDLWLLNQILFRCFKKQRVWNYEKIGAPLKKEFYLFFKNNGLQNQSVMYRKDAKEKIS
jgi:prolyl oligopeptidase